MHHFDKPKCEIIIFVFGLNFKKYKGENRRECKRRIGKIIKETNEEGNVTLDEMVKQVASLEDAISIVNKYEGIVRTQKEKIIILVFKQRYILKKFKNTEHFFEMIGLREIGLG